MQTQTFYRKANVTSAEAIASIERAFPNAKLVDFEKKVAEDKAEAISARANIGDEIYVVSLQKKAEFPPKEVGDGGAAEAEEGDSGSDSPEPPESDDESPDSEETDSPDALEDLGDEEPEEEKLSPEEETVSLLKQILDALKGGGGSDLGPPDLGPDAGLPDIGAPGPEGLPAPGPKPPLPPPIKEKKPVGGPAFASFDANAEEVTLTRDDVDETVTTASIKDEAENFWPTHKVASIRRNTAELVAKKQARIVLVKR